MTEPTRTPYAEQARAGMREAALDATYDAVVGAGWSTVRMADLAAAVGVSRQTLYNEFGTRDGLVQALVLRENERFLDGIETALAGHPDSPVDGVAEAVRYALDRAAEDPLTKAVLTSARGADDLLPWLTTRSEPVLAAATERLTGYLVEHWPALDRADVVDVCDSLVRLTVSHLVLPLAPTEVTARRLARLAERFLAAPVPATAPTTGRPSA